MNNEVFAKISNKIMSVHNGEFNEKGVKVFNTKNSYLDIVKDDKIIKVVYEFIIGTNLKGLYTNSLDNLIINCGYAVNKKSQKSFKDLLILMNNNNIVNILNEDFKPKDVLIIDTDNLYNDTLEGFTIIEQKELDIINSLGNNSKEINTLLKGYFFIKSMCYKREDNTYEGLQLDLSKAQYIVMDYKYINKFTGITDISKCIKTLKDGNLINYANFKEAPINNPTAKIDGKNVYVVRALECNWDKDLMNEELKVGLNQYKNKRIKESYIISTEFKNNDKVANGHLGKEKQMKKKYNEDVTIEEKPKMLITNMDNLLKELFN